MQTAGNKQFFNFELLLFFLCFVCLLFCCDSVHAQSRKPSITATVVVSVPSAAATKAEAERWKKTLFAVVKECRENSSALSAAIEVNKRGRTELVPEYQEMYIEGRESRVVEKKTYPDWCNSITIKRKALKEFFRKRKAMYKTGTVEVKKMDELEYELKNAGVLSEGEPVKSISFKDCEKARKLFDDIALFLIEKTGD